MKQLAKEKMESLIKYVPFIDFALKIDREKYIKFINIRKWIILKKKNYPLSDINKIEQSIITQYKNLLVENNVQIPQNITNIFAPMNLNQFVNLCSDDEEDDIQNKTEKVDCSIKSTSKRFELKDKSRHLNTNQKYCESNIIVDDSEDDLEIVSVDYGDKTKKIAKQVPSSKTNISKDISKEDVDMDEISKDILCKIDKLAAEDKKMKNSAHEPNNYTYRENDFNDSVEDDAVIYQRRSTASDLLFKRRTDFTDDEVIVENLADRGPYLKSNNIICLESDSDNEGGNDAEAPLISHKADNIEKDKTALKENKNPNNNINDNNILNKQSEKMLLICNSIDSVLPDMNELQDELLETNGSTSDLSHKQIPQGINYEDSNIQPTSKNNTDSVNIPNLSAEQVSKLYEALSCLGAMASLEPNVAENVSSVPVPSETPPPAPPPIANNIPTTSAQPCYLPQHQTFSNPPLMSNHYQYTNFVPNTVVAPTQKINFKDPRIQKHLQTIKNSPLFSYNVSHQVIEESIKQMCQTQQLQHPQPFQQTNLQTSSAYTNNKNMNNPCSKTLNTTHKSSISYGEYKRRQKELDLERQRKIQQEAKNKAEKEGYVSEFPVNSTEYIRSILISTLKPCKDQLTTLWNKQNCLSSHSSRNESSEMSQTPQEARIIRLVPTSAGEINNGKTNIKKNKTLCTTDMKKTGHKKEGNFSQNNADQKLNRIYKELKCTFKGFDELQDYITEEPVENSSKSNRKSNCLDSDTNSSHTAEVRVKHIGLRRRSSISALLAISEQLGQRSSDCSDSELNQRKNLKRSITHSPQNSAPDNLSQDSISIIPKRRKTIDEIIKPTTRAKNMRILDDDTSSEEGKITNKVTKEPVIRLRRLTQDVIKKHTKRLQVNDQSSRLNKTCEKIQKIKVPVQKTSILKKYNNDCQMTERTTPFCVLCRCKPSDLTNHYIGRHKTESYVARLDWSELEDLAINTPFAKFQPTTKNCRFERYEVVCPFCKEKVVDQFMNLYNHYAAHTGEYAFRCSHCQLAKPYRPDIQSHILHSKTCRNSSIQVMYRYPPHAQYIYLHYCTICNFVQLNEANVLKHLREHHDKSKAIASNIDKCILAAISDRPDANETDKSPPNSPATTLPPTQEEKTTAVSTKMLPGEENQLMKTTTDIANEMKFKVDDDDIPVGNEPCLEDEDKYSLEDQLKHMHKDFSHTNYITPMTVIHSLGNNINDPTGTGHTVQNFNSLIAQRHVPVIIKSETINEEPSLIISSPSSSNYNPDQVLRNYVVYEKYRSYPENVNYLGLYKCMIDDCYFSTDCSEDMYKHLTDHSLDELKPNEYLQCPYCVVSTDVIINPLQLVEHIRSQHGNMNYQCSICCYRSSDASNVHIHQQMHHKRAQNTCKIYKCFGEVLETNHQPNIDLDNQMARNVYKISCKLCSAGFYNTQFLIHHLQRDHNLTKVSDLKIYSCIYCPLAVDNENQIRIHVATKHPREPPLIYDHNKQINSYDVDCKRISNIVDMSESVAWIEVKSTEDAVTEEDVKPNLKELLHASEETAKIRLQKLTAHTGIPPDKLYRCPEPTCGGFFSVFELWLKHMRARHYSLECQCPHCPTVMLLSLEQFELHFEQHRRHTFICFNCSTTTSTELLARLHTAQQHSDLGIIRFEKIRFNLSYSYSIMIQSDLFKEREIFIPELLTILDNRLKKFEDNEMKQLKHQWHIRDNIPWIEEYLENLSNRKVARRCLVKYCTFRTLREDNLYRHLSNSHTINGTQFSCSKCDYHVEKCNTLDELFNHIKLHNEYTFICVACSLNTSSRSKMSTHIAEYHSARDVPVIHLFRTNQQMYMKIYIVFSDNHLTFSTMKNCFCCSEQDMSGDVFSLHLKRYHKLSLHYYCEKCSNFSIKSLKEVKPHFQQAHNSDNYKIRCELAAHNDLSIPSLNDFQVQILSGDSVPEQTCSSLHIKSEPLDVADDDNVILLEDDDIVIQNSIRDDQLKPAKEIPKLKCASLNKLLEPSSNISIASSSSIPTSFPSLTSSLAPTSVIDQTSHGPLITNRKIAAHTLNSTTAASAVANSTGHFLYNNTVISSVLPNNYNILTKIGSPVSLSTFTQHVPKNLHMA